MTVFEELSFDVFFEISKYLDLDDIAHLCQTCRQVQGVLLNNIVSRQVVEVSDSKHVHIKCSYSLQAHHAYTEEAQQARQGVTTYKEAFCAIYDRRQAFSNAQPYSARIIGQGNSILYRQGVLCVQSDHMVCVTNLHSGTPGFEMDIKHILTERQEWIDGDLFEMMYYSDEIVTIHITNNDRHDPNTGDNESWLVSLSTSRSIPNRDRVLGVLIFPEDTKVFVRHTSKYIFYGMHCGVGLDGHRKWVIKGNLINTIGENESMVYNSPFLLEDFHGSDIGSTVAFEIHDGYFYAVSNQGTYEVEEVDWTSFYHCVRVPLDNPVVEAMQRNTRVYRRQHAEGAIHDSWTDMTLQHDEETNDLFIVESRREWIRATSKQARTFYTSRIDFDEFEDSLRNVGSSGNITPPLPLPENDILTTVLESSHNANYMPTPKHYSWTRHPEFPSMAQNPRPFILARTKFRAYNFSCSAFIDLVEDDKCCPIRPINTQPCLRFRIGSRRIAPTLARIDHEDKPPPADSNLMLNTPRDASIQFADKAQYRYTPVRMWPPPPTTCPCAARLHGIINPIFRSETGSHSGQKNITTICDQRSVVYMVKPRSRLNSYASMSLSGSAGSSSSGASSNLAKEEGLGSIVFVDFGRSNPSSPPPYADENRRDWTPGQQKRCRAGTCA